MRLGLHISDEPLNERPTSEVMKNIREADDLIGELEVLKKVWLNELGCRRDEIDAMLALKGVK